MSVKRRLFAETEFLRCVESFAKATLPEDHKAMNPIQAISTCQYADWFDFQAQWCNAK